MDTTGDDPLYYSRFGGLWTDRRDARAILAHRQRTGELDEVLGKAAEQFIEHGFAVFEGAVDPALCDAYWQFVESAWRTPPAPMWAHWKRQVVPLSMAIYDDVAKVSDVHYHYRGAAELIFPDVVRRFLASIYERPPVVFQTMTMRKGSEEELHTDTGPLTLTEPCALAASWLALEDVDPRAGALQYVPGSHHVEVLVGGVSKAHHGNYTGYGEALAEIRRRCAARGMPTRRFLAKKGDVLVWAADLLHGGAPIELPTLTRKSLVAHFMPHGAMPTFYDFSGVGYVRYPSGAYRLDRVMPVAEYGPADVAGESGANATATALPAPMQSMVGAIRARMSAHPLVRAGFRIRDVLTEELRRPR